MKVTKSIDFGKKAKLWKGDCRSVLPTLKSGVYQLVLTSPPYNIGKSYEKRSNIEDYLSFQEEVLSECWRVLKPNGSLCWQVGNYVHNGAVIPLDLLIYPLISKLPGAQLRNRIVWVYPHGLHCTNRLSGRYEVVLWFTKGNDYKFNLDAIRVPQKYPNKKSYKGPKKGQISSNPLGKNPTDVWEIHNVKSNHPEKTIHPCQYPIELAERLILSLTNDGDFVLDPFAGVATTAVATLLSGRKAHAIEKDRKYIAVAKKRMNQVIESTEPKRTSIAKCA